MTPFHAMRLRNSGPPPPPAWTPADLFTSGEDGIWLDGSDTSQMWGDTGKTVAITGNNQSVRVVVDKSGHAYELTSPSDAARPEYFTDGSNGYWLAGYWVNYSLGILNSKSAFTKLLAVGTPNPIANGVLDGAPGACSIYQIASSTNIICYSNPAVSGTSSLASAGITAGAKQDFIQVFDGSLTATHAARNKLYVDNVQATWTSTSGTINATTAASNRITVGASDNLAALSNMRIYQYIVIDRLLTAPEIVSARAFLRAKMGL